MSSGLTRPFGDFHCVFQGPSETGWNASSSQATARAAPCRMPNAELFLNEADICPAVWLQGTVRRWSPAPHCHEHPHHITTFIKYQSPACVSCLYSASRNPFLKFSPSTAGNLLLISTLDLLTTNVIAVCFSKLSSSLKSSTAKQVFVVHNSSSQ